MNSPRFHVDFHLGERALPRMDVQVVRVNQGAIDVEQDGRRLGPNFLVRHRYLLTNMDVTATSHNSRTSPNTGTRKPRRRVAVNNDTTIVMAAIAGAP